MTMSESQMKTMERWFGSLSREIDKIKTGMADMATKMATKDDLDKLHGLIERVHRRIDEHLSNDDKDKRIFRLALERLEDKVESLQAQI